MVSVNLFTGTLCGHQAIWIGFLDLLAQLSPYVHISFTMVFLNEGMAGSGLFLCLHRPHPSILL